MAEEDKAKGASATEILAAEAKKTEAAPAAEKVAEKAAPAADPAPAAPKEQTVPLSRLQAVIAQKAEAERAREAIARELEAATSTLEEFKALGSKKEGDPAPAKGPATAKPLSQEELQRLVNEEGARQVFNQRCNDAVAAGRTAHQDFDKIVLGDLASISPVIDRVTGRPAIPVPLIEAALETGNAPEVLYALGQNVNEASRIMSLRPVAQAVELAKFAAKLEQPTKEDVEATEELENVSKAPAPIKRTVVKGPTKPAFTVFDTDNFSTEEWIKQREKQVKEARAR